MNEVLTSSTGVILSQSPGTGFPHFESCSWVVKVEPGYNITFTIEHFQTSRQFDELEVFDGGSLQRLRKWTYVYYRFYIEMCYLQCPSVLKTIHDVTWSTTIISPYPSPKSYFHRNWHFKAKWARQLDVLSETKQYTSANKKILHRPPFMVTEHLHLLCTFVCDQRCSHQLCLAAHRKWRLHLLVMLLLVSGIGIR